MNRATPVNPVSIKKRVYSRRRGPAATKKSPDNTAKLRFIEGAPAVTTEDVEPVEPEEAEESAELEAPEEPAVAAAAAEAAAAAVAAA